ncbi:MAG: cyclic nucleotide-binding domain-containing protein [Alphaproteobacteria bacterium]
MSLKDLYNRQLYKIGENIIAQGDKGSHLYIIESGEVEVIKSTDQGEKILGKLVAGQLFGEMALIDKSPRMATVRATDNTVCIKITDEQIKEMLDNSHPFVKNLVRILVNNLRDIQN